MKSAKVGIREFRENLSSYLESTKPKPSQADLGLFALPVKGCRN